MTQSDSYALARTLDSYEVEELDGLELARFFRNEAINDVVLEGFRTQLDRESLPEAA